MDTPLHDRTLPRVLKERATRSGDRPFLHFEGRSFSYGEAYELSRRLAGGLRAAGIEAGQHVAVMMENRPETLWLNFALAMLGAVSVPVNNAARGDVLAYYVGQCECVAIVLDTSFLDRFNAVATQCPLVATAILFQGNSPAAAAGALPAGIRQVAWDSLRDAPALGEEAGPAYSDVLQILHSSGTTGRSKGTMIAHATALLTSGKYCELNGYGSSDVMYTCLPMFHGNAWHCTIFPALMAGGSVALAKRFSASGFWRDINATGATHCSLLSAMIDILWQLPPGQQERSHRLRVCLVVPTPEFSLEFEQRYGVKIASLYSLCDFGLSTVLAPEDPRDKIRSAGRPLPEVSVAILDGDDLPVPTGVVGEICLRNNTAWFARQGYYKMPETYVNATRNFWFHTGDRGRLDEDGYLYFAGRNKEMIRRRGENISALQVEQVIKRHPAVADVAVYAVRAEFAEDEVMASVVCREGQSLEQAELVRFCEPQMAYFMVPRFIEFLPALPVTPTNKVEKYKLREAAEQRLAQVWDREKSGIVLAH